MHLVRRHGSLTDAGSPLARPTNGSLHLTTHHAIFEASEPAADKGLDGLPSSVAGSQEKPPTLAREVWASHSFRRSASKTLTHTAFADTAFHPARCDAISAILDGGTGPDRASDEAVRDV